MSDIKFYLRLLLRRSPVMIILILLASAVGAAMAMRLPATYQTSARLLVEDAQIPDNVVRSTIQTTQVEQLEIIQQRLLTRANLIDIANKHRVFPNAGEMTPDEIVKEMRQKTRIRRVSGRDRATLMNISFEGASPRTVANVVNEYVSIALEINSDFRDDRTAGTLEFFEQEVRALSENLDRQNAKVLEFKRLNADALPENLDYRLNRQSLQQERLARSERELALLKDQIERIKETGSLADADVALSPEQQQLNALEKQLNSNLSIYSPENPKVKILQSRIEGLRAQISGLSSSADAEARKAAAANALEISLAELSATQSALEESIDAIEQELADLGDSIDRTPLNSITLNAMERERSQAQSLYGSAVQKLAAAQLGERVELSAKGERITVLESANVPSQPSGPNRQKVAATGVAVGLGLAGAFFLLLELINQSVRRPSDITSQLGITPLCTVPQIETALHRRLRRTAQVGVLLVVLIAVPAALWAIDTYYLPLDLIFEKIKDRLV